MLILVVKPLLCNFDLDLEDGVDLANLSLIRVLVGKNNCLGGNMGNKPMVKDRQRHLTLTFLLNLTGRPRTVFSQFTQLATFHESESYLGLVVQVSQMFYVVNPHKFLFSKCQGLSEIKLSVCFCWQFMKNGLEVYPPT